MALLNTPSSYNWSSQGQQQSKFQDWMNTQRTQQQGQADQFLANRQPYYGQMYQGMMQAGTPAIQDQYNRSLLKNKYAGSALGQMGGSDDWRRQGEVSTAMQGEMGNLNAQAQGQVMQQQGLDSDAIQRLKLASLQAGVGDSASAQSMAGMIQQQGQGQQAYYDALMQQMQQQMAMGNANSQQYGQYLMLLANTANAASRSGSYV